MQASTSAQGAHGWRARTHAPSLKRAPTHWRTRQTPAHAAPPTSSLAPRTARERVLELLAQGQDNYNHTDELRQAVEALIPENPTRCPGLVIEEGLGTGTWKVFWAPHIATMSQTLLGTKFDPILYKFFGDGRLVSNVKYTSSLIGQGWLSASGTMQRKTDDTVEINFDKFWVDSGDNLREELTEERTTKVLGVVVNADSLLSSVGRAGFFPQLALFPVLYMDQDLAVFEFPPLNSKIAIHRQR